MHGNPKFKMARSVSKRSKIPLQRLYVLTLYFNSRIRLLYTSVFNVSEFCVRCNIYMYTRKLVYNR